SSYSTVTLGGASSRPGASRGVSTAAQINAAFANVRASLGFTPRRRAQSISSQSRWRSRSSDTAADLIERPVVLVVESPHAGLELCRKIRPRIAAQVIDHSGVGSAEVLLIPFVDARKAQCAVGAHLCAARMIDEGAGGGVQVLVERFGSPR